ncbi:MAG: hypothetical protein IPL39_03130 [Opitutaceae bacterium]|nr:hypothetical protein [Opitutaceae bacterium]
MYLKAHERDAKLRVFCDEWLLGALTGGADVGHESKIASLAVKDPNAALMCAVSLVELAGEEVADEALAGPFELVLAKHGADFIDVVCELCRALPRLPRILSCIWGQHIPRPVMRKLELFRSI